MEIIYSTVVTHGTYGSALKKKRDIKPTPLSPTVHYPLNEQVYGNTSFLGQAEEKAQLDLVKESDVVTSSILRLYATSALITFQFQ